MLGLDTSAEARLVFPRELRRGVLADASIYDAVRLGLIEIEPFNEKHVEACSYDLEIGIDQPIVLHPSWLSPASAFALLSSRERIRLPACIRAQVHTRSSVARKGVFMQFTAGFIDPGFDGQITFEAINLGRDPVQFEPGDRVAQVEFAWLDQDARNPYQGRYQNQRGPTPSRFKHGDL